MGLHIGNEPGVILRKRCRDDSVDSLSMQPLKIRRNDNISVVHPKPESTQSSHAKSPLEDRENLEGGKLTLEKPALSPRKASVKSQHKAPAAHAERTNFLGDLNNYVALGSFTFFLTADQRAQSESADWTELELEFSSVLTSGLEKQRTDGELALSAVNLWLSGLARVYYRKHQVDDDFITIRIHVLPDDVGRRYIDRLARKGASNPRMHLEHLMNELDKSPESWEGCNYVATKSQLYDIEAEDTDSLFYLFNTLPSPKISTKLTSNRISRDAIKSVLESVQLQGLNTPLYPYQKRTVAKMIQREVQPERALDPRFQILQGPTGHKFFYDTVTSALLHDRREYEEVRGGILGESMGLGKTLICLATIIATQGHWPEVPPEYSTNLQPVRAKVGSLAQMAAAAVGRNQIPWRLIFQDALRAGQEHKAVISLLEENVGSYVIPPAETKYSRRLSRIPKGKTIRLSSATLIIVPQNLLSQWMTEIHNHVEDNRLHVLYLDSGNETSIPSADEILDYDVILMSRPRFEKEMVPGDSVKAFSDAKRNRGGCSCPLDRDCQCSKHDEYQSPLKEIHWFRIIMDEGHEFSSSGRSSTTYWALQNLRVERKWIVSGTPANGLIGVEVGTAACETSDGITDRSSTSNQEVLEIRRRELALTQERKDLEKFGILVNGFLRVKPWANSSEEDSASWQKYIMPHKDGRRKAGSLKRLLESLVVRHRIEDIEADIQLPPLYNRVVHLQPSWHDKLSLNLFLLILAVNAVTSERVDEDYMFHPKNRRQLNVLINNLRQAGFYWTSIGPDRIAKTLKISRTYLEEHKGESPGYNAADRMLLEKAVSIGELALGSPSWKSFADTHEMGIYATDFPEKAQSAWSLVLRQGCEPLLIGATQLAKAQKWVDNHLYAPDPSSGLAEIGTSTMQKLWQAAQEEPIANEPEDLIFGEQPKNRPGSKIKSSPSRLPKLTSERTVSRAKAAPKVHKPRKEVTSSPALVIPEATQSNSLKPALKSALKKPSMAAQPIDTLSDSPIVKSKICGTASAKLSYLLDRLTVLHETEKILVFYEGDQIAWYIAQALDLTDVRYLIYTKSLSLARQTAYIATFNRTETFRVLLMNVHQAAHGLHIAAASRVFFVNPVWQPNVEAQAIKRAHRIGQTRPVYVETLVLKDTLEDQMLQRRKGMTAQEHQKAEKSLLDDDTMSGIIQRAQFLPFSDDEVHDVQKQIAKLEHTHQIFARAGTGQGDPIDADADLIFSEEMPLAEKQKRKRSSGRASKPVSVEGTSLTPLSYAWSQRQANFINPDSAMTTTGSEDAHMPASSHEIGRMDSESHSVPAEGPSSTKKTTLPPASHKNPMNSSQNSNPSPIPPTPSSSQNTASSSSSSKSTGPSKKRRVGFAVNPTDRDNDEPSSLFGNGSPNRPTNEVHERDDENGMSETMQAPQEPMHNAVCASGAPKAGVKFALSDP